MMLYIALLYFIFMHISSNCLSPHSIIIFLKAPKCSSWKSSLKHIINVFSSLYYDAVGREENIHQKSVEIRRNTEDQS